MMITDVSRSCVDMAWRYDYAMIRMPDGSVIQGTLEAWKNFHNSDTIQLKIDGKIYLTHYKNVVLISN